LDDTPIDLHIKRFEQKRQEPWFSKIGVLKINQDVLFNNIKRCKMPEKKCLCPTECDCQNPPPDDWDGENGPWHVSNECPVHNWYPRPNPECPLHAGMSELEFDTAKAEEERERKKEAELLKLQLSFPWGED